MPIFSRAVLCSLTGNILGLKSRGGWHADNARTMCGWLADDMWMTREWDFIGDFSWQMTYVIRTLSAGGYIIHTSSAGMYVICTSSAGTYVIHMSSAELLMVSMDLNYLSTLTGSGYWMEFVTRMLSCFISGFQDHVNDLRHNLCWWFSLHVASGHCSHVICICTCHPHIIWAYAYYAHIICSGPWYIPS